MQSAYRSESGKSDCPGRHALCLLQVAHLETWPYRVVDTTYILYNSDYLGSIHDNSGKI